MSTAAYVGESSCGCSPAGIDEEQPGLVRVRQTVIVFSPRDNDLVCQADAGGYNPEHYAINDTDGEDCFCIVL